MPVDAPKKTLATVLTGLSGLAFGIVVSVAAGGGSGRPAPAAAPLAPPAPFASTSTVSGVVTAIPVRTPHDASAAAHDTISLEEARRQRLAARDALLDTFAKEQDEPTWSRPTEELLAADIATIGAKHAFHAKSVSCKSSLCVIELEWMSYGEAVRSLEAVAAGFYRANCPRGLILDDPDKPDGAYSASLVFECESWRKAGGKPLDLPPIPDAGH